MGRALRQEMLGQALFPGFAQSQCWVSTVTCQSCSEPRSLQLSASLSSGASAYFSVTLAILSGPMGIAAPASNFRSFITVLSFVHLARFLLEALGQPHCAVLPQEKEARKNHYQVPRRSLTHGKCSDGTCAMERADPEVESWPTGH
jgi:hypothetical protein